MSDKQLQRVTEGVADIGHASVRRALPAHRAHTTQKIRITGIACPMSIALQYGVSLEKLGDLLTDAKFEPCCPVSGHDRLERKDFAHV